ncbi:MAG: hypothetical protein M1434_14595 [Chloroflexi bacterium]|nr:hypothetical protein [Chloroflexota bacterium]
MRTRAAATGALCGAGGVIVGSRGVRSANRESYDPISRYDDIGLCVIVLP